MKQQRLYPHRSYTANRALDPFHRSGAQIRALFCGNGTGKTYGSLMEAVLLARGEHPHKPNFPVPNEGWIISSSAGQGERVLMPIFRKIMPHLKTGEWAIRGRPGSQRVEWNNGSLWHLLSSEADPDTFAGAEPDWIAMDEEAKAAVADECFARMRHPHQIMWITLTPLNGMTWVYDKIFNQGKHVWRHGRKESHIGDDEDIEIFRGSPMDNLANLDPKYINDMKKRWGANPKELQVRMSGDFVEFAGLILNEFDEKIHVIEQDPSEYFGDWPDGLTHYMGIDSGLKRPYACILFSVDRNGYFYITDEYYIKDSTEAIHPITRKVGRSYHDHAVFIKQFEGMYNPRLIVIDNDVNSPDPHHPEHKIIKIYRDLDIRLTLAQKKGKREHIALIKNWLRPDEHGISKLRVFRRCPNVIAEAHRWRWANAPKDGRAHSDLEHQSHNHTWACVRYISAFNPRWREDSSRRAYGGSSHDQGMISETIGY